MAEEKLNRRERIVLGVYGMGTLLLGVAMTADMPMDIAGRMVPPDPWAARLAAVIGLGTVVASVVLATRYFGSKPGLKLMLREAWAGLLAGAIAGFLSGFILGAIFPGPARLVGILMLYGGAMAIMFAFANKATER